MIARACLGERQEDTGGQEKLERNQEEIKFITQ